MHTSLITILIVVGCCVVAIVFFMVGMSLTQLIKGHPLDSEISTNAEMQRRGIKCAVQEAREEMAQQLCDSTPSPCSGNCAGCDVEHEIHS
jgi:NhaP-type Na+/H+ or K+/H+ antiporter